MPFPTIFLHWPYWDSHLQSKDHNNQMNVIKNLLIQTYRVFSNSVIFSALQFHHGTTSTTPISRHPLMLALLFLFWLPRRELNKNKNVDMCTVRSKAAARYIARTYDGWYLRCSLRNKSTNEPTIESTRRTNAAHVRSYQTCAME